MDSNIKEKLVARESELAELRQALDEAFSRAGSVAVINGEAGIGKTGLVEAFEHEAISSNARVLWGRCDEQSGAPAFWLWIQAIRSYVRASDPDDLAERFGDLAPNISEIVPELGNLVTTDGESDEQDDPDASRFRLFDAISSLFRRVSDQQPLILILEDIHIADGDSLALLEFLSKQLFDMRLLVVGTYRDIELGRSHPLSRALAELRRSNRFRRVHLRRLDRVAVARLVSSIIGATPPAGFADAIHDATEGNPLFVTEILQLMKQEKQLSPEALVKFRQGDLPLPEGVREAIGQHLDKLSSGCNELLNVAAVIGRQFSYQHIANLTTDPESGLIDQMTENALAELLDEAIEARVLKPGCWSQRRHMELTSSSPTR